MPCGSPKSSPCAGTSQTGLDLVQILVLAVQQYFTENAPVAIVLVVFHEYDFTGDGIRQMFLRLRAVCLAAFRRVDALEADLVLSIAGVEYDYDTTKFSPNG